jgi:hypothetical protein
VVQEVSCGGRGEGCGGGRGVAYGRASWHGDVHGVSHGAGEVVVRRGLPSSRARVICVATSDPTDSIVVHQQKPNVREGLVPYRSKSFEGAQPRGRASIPSD